eukprot:13440696-Ditylum_brightwellii.AAC.1
MSYPAESCITKGKLYRLNNVTADEQAKWPHTGHWNFVPFAAKGNITDAHITNMFQFQNHYLHDTVGISVKGFSSLDVILEPPSTSRQISLHQWFLTTTTATYATKLFTLVDVDPNNINYFCTDKPYKEEAIEWLDNLPELLQTTLTFDQICKICKNDKEDLSCSYCEVLADNTQDTVCGFEKILRGTMNIDKDDKPLDVEENNLCNCWKSPP